MVKEVRLMLEYQCYPIWLYDENGSFIDNDLISEIEENRHLLEILEELQRQFDGLYLDSQEKCEYIGFTSELDKGKFEEMAINVYTELCIALGRKYSVLNMIDVNSM